ncbi:contractile injection system tape measure protein [Streptomyces sp. P17]|uniref:contractile injection system tape measure protein n=1 Tax=Streptomyces sp. P17 TaxID=3074716 RepID=UPI0028F445B5|nr:contractile injection system tape measure protein [Streptomyces sp. P17]MDT9694957.1 contractile injection system tape measure protein [Streptomyces sp. P17]
MTDVAVDTVRLRGPHARRLAGVAARALPAALERALADIGDVQVDDLVVRLDVDVTAHDDETLAVLWADAIRVQLTAVRRESAPVVPRPSAGEPPGRRGPGPRDVLAVVHALCAPDAEPRTPLPRAVLELADSGTTRAVAEELGADAWASLLRGLSHALRLPVPERATATGPAAPAPGPQPLPAPSPAVSEGAYVKKRPADEADSVAARVQLPFGPSDILDILAELSQLVDESTAAVDTAALTRGAGLVLLYPWLAEHCRRAEDLHPGLEGLAVREAALAAIVGPDDPALADDPLIGLLAGRTSPEPAAPRVPLPRRDEVAESAVAVLTSFAALLPGFERSSPAYLRGSWITRLGVVDHDRDPALLTAATRPLDVVLTRLPYPVGLIKLPWSPPLTVRFRP